MSFGVRAALLVSTVLLADCRLATTEAPEPSCYAPEVVSCEACHDRQCSWCPEGPDPADGYCCNPACIGTPLRCPHAIRPLEQCPNIGPCETSTITSCEVCQERGCYWCPRAPARGGQGVGRCRDPDPISGVPPRCEGIIGQADDCPGTNP